MSGKLLASAGNKTDPEKAINNFYCNTNGDWMVTEDNKIYNKRSGVYSSCVVRKQRGRWRFELGEN